VPWPSSIRGSLITFEGGEGAGKSTQIRKLCERLVSEGKLPETDVVRVREPGGTSMGEGIRELLKRRDATISSEAEAFLFAACRAQLVTEVIMPALKSGKVVVCDRFADSTVAYQQGGRGLPRDSVRAVNELACQGITPRLTFLLDLPAEVGLARAATRDGGSPDRLEALDLAFHQRVRATYQLLAAAEPARFLVLNAALSPDALAESIWHEVTRRFS
jgi:dTMP kinase